MDAISRGSALERDRIAQQGGMVKGPGSSQNRGSFIAFKGKPAAKNAREEEVLQNSRIEINNFLPGQSRAQNGVCVATQLSCSLAGNGVRSTAGISTSNCREN